MKIALGIEYRGTGFNGWQIQPDCPSVQQALEDALETFLQVKTPTMCAGRTDTGVHAMQQVVSIETQADRPERSWVRGLNTYLPPGVAVRWARRVDDDFHARFSARSRTYEYWIYNDPVRTIRRLELERRGRLIGVRIEANAFLQHMVRNIVGTLIYVGTGREKPEWVEEVLKARSRAAAAPTFSPNGLYLMGVGYEDPSIPAAGLSPFGWEDPEHPSANP